MVTPGRTRGCCFAHVLHPGRSPGQHRFRNLLSISGIYWFAQSLANLVNNDTYQVFPC